MAISLEEVHHVAKLARLELDEQELRQFQMELNALIGHFEDIGHIDVSLIEPKPHAIALTNVWDHDVAQVVLSREQALQNAPVTRAGLFVVPTILEG